MKKETILTSLTANTHMRERAAPAEASGQSCGTMFFFHVFLDFVYPRHLPTPTTHDFHPLPTTFSYTFTIWRKNRTEASLRFFLVSDYKLLVTNSQWVPPNKTLKKHQIQDLTFD